MSISSLPRYTVYPDAHFLAAPFSPPLLVSKCSRLPDQAQGLRPPWLHRAVLTRWNCHGSRLGRTEGLSPVGCLWLPILLMCTLIPEGG